mmetsp:Transcript_31322/g.66660  ORF Transcript_31322/g.66660 Transcript_31322/m.66660 type:complete len:214 (+) Transcript_31322:195-836(+)
MRPLKGMNRSAGRQSHAAIPDSDRTIRATRRHSSSIGEGNKIHDPSLVRGEGASDEFHGSGHVRLFIVARRIVRIQLAIVIAREEERTVRPRKRQRANGKGGVDQSMHPPEGEIPPIISGRVNVNSTILPSRREGVRTGRMEGQRHDAGVPAADRRDYLSGSRFGQDGDALYGSGRGVSYYSAGRCGILAPGTGSQKACLAKDHRPVGAPQRH